MDRAKIEAAYFMRRASEERAAAERACDPRARQTHSDLAERYAQAARDCEMDYEDDRAMRDAPPVVPLLQPEFRILP
jgi:hypothetical protein